MTTPNGLPRFVSFCHALQVLKTFNCWLLLWGCWTTLGAYGVIALNLAQICEAFGRKDATAFCVTLTMVAAACGRVG